MKLAEVYTLHDLRDGSWATWLAKEGKNGTHVLSVLCARENSAEESFEGIARARFLSDDSLELVVFWEKLPRKVEALMFLPQTLLAAGIRVRGYEAGAGILPSSFRYLPATRCKRCGRMLTRPASIDSGLGEICSGHKPRAGSKYQAAKEFRTPEEMRKKILNVRQEKESRKRFRFGK